jgi:hypothetical protein
MPSRTEIVKTTTKTRKARFSVQRCIKKREACLDASDSQHAREFLRDVDILVGDDELHARESEQANIDNEIFSDSTALVIVG